MKFYRCNHCENVFIMADEETTTPTCCGGYMKLLVANATDGDVAKHMPVIERKGSKTTVKVGSSLHPMTKEHRIEWICLTDGKASMVEELTSNDEPVVTFTPEKLAADHLSAYAFCNLHGLWQTDEK